MCDAVRKTKSGYNYKYTDINEILANVSAGMQKYGVSLVPAMVSEMASVEQNTTHNTKVDKTGKVHETVTTEMLFRSPVKFKWVNDENPEDFIEVPWFITGSMPDCSQSMGAACSYGLRQFLTTYFQIAQFEYDVDAYRSQQREAAVAEDKAVAQAIIEQFDSALKTYLAAHPEQKDSCVKMVSKYAKGAQYSKITDPQLAAKLLEEFHNTYMKEDKEDA